MRRGTGLAWLTLAVAGLHALSLSWLAQQLPRPGGDDANGIERIEVAFVRELQPSAPPVVVRAVPALERAVRAAPVPVAEPASAAPLEAQAAAKASDRSEAADTAWQVPPPADALAQAAAAAPSPASAASSASPVDAQRLAATGDAAGAPAQGAALATAAASASGAAPTAAAANASAVAAPAPELAASTPVGDTTGAPAFEWPLSTRLSYTLFGNYRGPIDGDAQVDWLRRGDRYQVHLDVRMASVASRRMSSEGRLTEQGLQPLRYEEVTEVLLREPRRLTVRFERDRIVLADGTSWPALPQVQDTASQFVQLTWLFTTRSDLLRPGQAIEMPLALPGRVDRWIYDVQPEEDLPTPVGLLRAFHLKPRAPPPRGTLVIETWFAPSLLYLPVRILIRQDESTYVDLTLSRLPQQEAAQGVSR